MVDFTAVFFTFSSCFTFFLHPCFYLVFDVNSSVFSPYAWPGRKHWPYVLVDGWSPSSVLLLLFSFSSVLFLNTFVTVGQHLLHTDHTTCDTLSFCYRILLSSGPFAPDTPLSFLLSHFLLLPSFALVTHFSHLSTRHVHTPFPLLWLPQARCGP